MTALAFVLVILRRLLGLLWSVTMVLGWVVAMAVFIPLLWFLDWWDRRRGVVR